MKVFYTVSSRNAEYKEDRAGSLEFDSVPRVGEYIYLNEFELSVEGVWYEYSVVSNSYVAHINLR